MIAYEIFLNLDTGDAVASFRNPRKKLLLGLVADTKTLFRLSFLRGETNQRLADITGLEITLAIDDQNPKPENGFWVLTNGITRTAPIPAQASNDDVTAIINASGLFPSNVTVKGGFAEWVITSNTSGAITPITGAFSGTTATSTLVINQLDGGTDITHATYRVEIIQAPALKILPDAWDVVQTSPASSLINIGGNIFYLILDPASAAGYFALTVNGTGVAGLDWNISAFDLEKTLSAALSPLTIRVQSHPLGGYLIKGATTLTLDDSDLIIPPFWQASAEVKSEGLSELIALRPYADAFVEIRLIDPISGGESSHILPVIVRQPVIRDTNAVTPAPPSILPFIRLFNPTTGLWHEVFAAVLLESPSLVIEPGDTIPGLNPVLITHATTSDIYTLHINNGGIVIAYYGDNTTIPVQPLTLEIDESNHMLVQATGIPNNPGLLLTTQETP